MGNGHPELGNEPFYDYKARSVWCPTMMLLPR